MYLWPQTLQRCSEIIWKPKVKSMPWNASLWNVAPHLVKKFFSFRGTKMFIGPLDSVLNQTKTVCIHVPDLFIKTPFHTLLHLHLTVYGLHSFFLQVFCMNFSFSKCMLHFPSILFSCFNYPILLGAQIMKVIIQCSPTSYVLSEIWIIFLILHLQKLLT
jgi:hypothetical protein